MAKQEAIEDPVVQRLDILIKLQTKIALSSIKEQKEKILFLTAAGMGPKSISETLALSIDTVKSTLKRTRKAASLKVQEAEGSDA